MKIKDLLIAEVSFYDYDFDGSGYFYDGNTVVVPTNNNKYINLFPNPRKENKDLILEKFDDNKKYDYAATITEYLIEYIPDEFITEKEYSLDDIDNLRDDVLELIIKSKQVDRISNLTNYCYSIKKPEDKVKTYYKKKN